MEVNFCDNCKSEFLLHNINNKKLCRTCYSEEIIRCFLYYGENSGDNCILQNMLYFDANKNGYQLEAKLNTAMRLNTILYSIETRT